MDAIRKGHPAVENMLKTELSLSDPVEPSNSQPVWEWDDGNDATQSSDLKGSSNVLEA